MFAVSIYIFIIVYNVPGIELSSRITRVAENYDFIVKYTFQTFYGTGS